MSDAFERVREQTAELGLAVESAITRIAGERLRFVLLVLNNDGTRTSACSNMPHDEGMHYVKQVAKGEHFNVREHVVRVKD